jgi:hypothetical protein
MSRRTTLAGILVALSALIAPFGVPATASTAGQVRAAKAATAGFTHPGGAAKAGYGLFKDTAGIACIAMKGMGGMGVHYVNGSLVDAKIQVRHPEAAVYRFTTNGHLKLAALEYLVLRKTWRAAHGANAPRPELFGHRFNLTPNHNRFGLPAFFSLHAWLWYGNPAGRYTMWNPRVHCPKGI